MFFFTVPIVLIFVCENPRDTHASHRYVQKVKKRHITTTEETVFLAEQTRDRVTAIMAAHPRENSLRFSTKLLWGFILFGAEKSR